MTFSLQNLTFDSQGLIPAIIQEQSTRTVLMLGYMNEEALMRTITEHRVTFWSRSRQELWRKGDTSGHIQTVQSISYDCDADALLIQVEQTGVACHTGEMTCFHNHDLNNNGEDS